MTISNQVGRILRCARYDEPTDFTGTCAMALASLITPDEGYVLGIECADHRVWISQSTRLVLTNERVVAFRPNPSAPMKRTHRLDEITNVEYDTGFLNAKLTFSGPGSFETYPVSKDLGREFVEAVRLRLD